MGVLALLEPPLLLLLLLALLDQGPRAVAQTQVCSAGHTVFQFKENTDISAPLTNLTVPADQHVELRSIPPSTFKILQDQLFLNKTLDYEETQTLQAVIDCKRGDTVVTSITVLVFVLDVNDNAPEFPFDIKYWDVTEDTKVNTVVIPEAELQATDKDKEDTLFYSLRGVTENALNFFSLEGANRPALKLIQSLDYLKVQNMTFELIVQDTPDNVEPSHTATATLVLNVLAADLRPPWFLPCSYSDGYICLQAQYHGMVPIGQKLPDPLTLRPGPIYAVDGDQGINQQIAYAIAGGNKDDTFAIDSASGNLTMAKSVSSPTIFVLLIRAEQTDGARYSITQATVEARTTPGNSPRFPQSTFRGTVEAGTEAGVAVKDASFPTRLLRIWAEDPEFPDLNSAIRYRITNSSNFEMDGEIVLTTTALEHSGVFYAEVEANNTMTGATATAMAEIQVTEQKPPATPSTGAVGGQQFSTVDMAVLGGVLGALLLLALIGLAILIQKHYGHRLKCCSGKAGQSQASGVDNEAFLKNSEASKASTPSPEPPPAPREKISAPPDLVPPDAKPPTAVRPRPEPLSPALGTPGPAGDSPSAVRSILTKERRAEGGYKAVWFGEDIGAEADVVVLNTPAAEADGGSDGEGSDGSGDEAGGKGSTHV